MSARVVSMESASQGFEVPITAEHAPNVFAFFAFIPLLGYAVRVVVAFWLLAATIIAVRQALDYKSTARAAAVVLIGWILFVLIQTLV